MTHHHRSRPRPGIEAEKKGGLEESLWPAVGPAPPLALPVDQIPYERRIFCNRNLKLSGIEAVGFDMDYTLLVYRETIAPLVARLALRHLVEHEGYPEEVLELSYDPEFAVRGLVIDRHMGNILKMDAHYHVTRVLHGTRALTSRQARAAYPSRTIRFKHEKYVLVDTLFELPETHLYAQLVDLAEGWEGRRRLKAREYARIYDDVRNAVDTVHRNGTLKGTVAGDFDRYVERDPLLAAMLAQFRSAGKRLFLLTNSEWVYTDRAMRHLLDGVLEGYASWRDYFDIIVVSARKPAFFTATTPFVELDDDGRPRREAPSRFEPGRIYQGGNLRAFESMAGFGGDRVLYVGDHIYGDVLRSKREAAWRTAMIVPEMEDELHKLVETRPLLVERDRIEHALRVTDDQRTRIRLRLAVLERRALEAGAAAHELAAIRAERARLRRQAELLAARQRGLAADLKRLQAHLDRQFNPRWGMLFKAGAEHSVFGWQVETYACIYTSRASNFALYSPAQYFRTPRDLLPHEHFELFFADEPVLTRDDAGAVDTHSEHPRPNRRKRRRPPK